MKTLSGTIAVAVVCALLGLAFVSAVDAQQTKAPLSKWEYATFRYSALGDATYFTWTSPDGNLEAEAKAKNDVEATIQAEQKVAKDLYSKIAGSPISDGRVPYGVLNAAGARGWEFCQIVPEPRGASLWIFKRQK